MRKVLLLFTSFEGGFAASVAAGGAIFDGEKNEDNVTCFVVLGDCGAFDDEDDDGALRFIVCAFRKQQVGRHKRGS